MKHGSRNGADIATPPNIQEKEISHSDVPLWIAQLNLRTKCYIDLLDVPIHRKHVIIYIYTFPWPCHLIYLVITLNIHQHIRDNPPRWR